MWRDKSPGLKILWLWTFGTAAVLVTNVMFTRMRDMDQIINAQDQDPPRAAAAEGTSGYDNTSSEFVRDES
ncbi:hypothetical protein AAHA92_13035 [Salvia divinorum]|uniref:Uncharacterized protein n=1 Tax=Salvia divinorum TaxID=28513 RepID=A0ABD1H6Z6_SALDI